MWTYNYSNELYHYGVKGMKWGVRRGSRPGLISVERRYSRDMYRKGKKVASKDGLNGVKTTVKFNKSAAKNVANKIRNSKRVKELKTNYEYGKQYGALGVGLNTFGQASRVNNKYMLKGAGAVFLNQSANSFIKNSNASYGVKRGVDFVRKAGITALAISTAKDTIQMYANIGASALGMRDAYSKK